MVKRDVFQPNAGIKEYELESRKKNASTVGLFTVSWTLQLLHLKTP